jgi:hypothetical protein
MILTIYFGAEDALQVRIGHALRIVVVCVTDLLKTHGLTMHTRKLHGAFKLRVRDMFSRLTRIRAVNLNFFSTLKFYMKKRLSIFQQNTIKSTTPKGGTIFTYVFYILICYRSSPPSTPADRFAAGRAWADWAARPGDFSADADRCGRTGNSYRPHAGDCYGDLRMHEG